jgi:hypothetical protein
MASAFGSVATRVIFEEKSIFLQDQSCGYLSDSIIRFLDENNAIVVKGVKEDDEFFV